MEATINREFQQIIFRTRGIYMFIALAVASVIKLDAGGTTPLSLFVASVAIALIAQTYRVWAATYLWGKQAVTAIQADFLCTDGPYAYVRNPFYLGNLIIGLSLAMAINEWYAYILFVVSYAFVYVTVIPYEEQFLQDKFGETYADYKAHTGRLIPKLHRYKKSREVIPDYRAGFWGEIHVPIILAIFFAVVYRWFVRFPL